MNTVNRFKKDFPIFTHSPNLVYLDSTATSLKPQLVVDALREYYEQFSANIYRGIYDISEKATEKYEKTRSEIARFINAESGDEVVFTRNTTESLNLIMYAFGKDLVSSGDAVAVTITEHHSNFVPWQELAKEKGARFTVIDCDQSGNLINIATAITKKTKILALTYVSNVLGTVNPVRSIIAQARKINPDIIIIVDSAQAVAHMPVDVRALGCDFLAFSSHKMFGPTGVGILWAKKSHLKRMRPFLFGGEMIETVHVEQTRFKLAPHKFEAGTPHIAGVIALESAVSYLQSVGWDRLIQHESTLISYAYDRLNIKIPGIQILGPKKHRSSIISFSLPSVHAHDIAQVLNEDHIAVRAGNHCAMPLHNRFGITATCRVSFSIYNTEEDVERLVRGLQRVIKIFH